MINTSQGLDPLTSRAQRASKTENQRKKEEKKIIVPIEFFQGIKIGSKINLHPSD